MLHGGRRPIDIYRRIYAGINGTPMPAFGDALADQPDTMWHLVHYIMSIVENRDVPGLSEVQPSVTADTAAVANEGSGSGGDEAVEANETLDESTASEEDTVDADVSEDATEPDTADTDPEDADATEGDATDTDTTEEADEGEEADSSGDE
jgi:hypothetical protein